MVARPRAPHLVGMERTPTKPPDETEGSRAMQSIRVLLVDDSREFLEQASCLLATLPAVEVVGRVRSGLQALELLHTLDADLVLMDVAMPGLNGIETTARIKARPKAPKVVVCTFSDCAAYRAAAAGAGADGFVCKPDLLDRLPLLLEDLRPKGVPS